MKWWLADIRKHSLVIAIVIAYIVADMVLTYREIYLVNLLPVLLVVIYLAFARLDLMYFLIIFLTPLSVQFIDFFPSSPVDFAIPTEPLLFGIMGIVIYKIIHEGLFDRRIINHPVTYAILFNLVWIFVTSLTSTMPLVSFKFLLARMWFIVTYYLLAIIVFRKTANIQVFIWCYVIPMLGVVVHTVIRHLGYGLYDRDVAHFVMAPFFRDHTSYGAVLAMLFFALIPVIWKQGTNILIRLMLFGALLIITIGLVLSYTRAAWISVFFSVGVLILTILRIKFRYAFLAGVIAFLYFFSQREEIIHQMKRNRQASSATISEHVQSISNITTDESNLERINRWNSAMRMFREKPITGWGPGTYMFKYAPFQRSEEKTTISTNFGDHGNAHSEYIGPLAESGILGSLSFIIIAVMSLLTAFRVYYSVENNRIRGITLGLILGYFTYIVHGLMNNFLDTDKASALFWGFTAVFVSLDIYYKNTSQEEYPGSEKLNPKN
jgi:O-antigen ligase